MTATAASAPLIDAAPPTHLRHRMVVSGAWGIAPSARPAPCDGGHVADGFFDWLILGGCAVALILWAHAFPHPSILIRRLLPPRKRWPEVQIRKWVANGRPAASYLRFFYRDPDRSVPAEAGLLAPADGLVTSLACRDGIRYVVIALSFWDVHVQRSPETGRVMTLQSFGQEYMDGEGRDFAFLMEKPCPVQLRIVVQTAVGEIAIRLVTSLAARRLKSFVKEGEVVERGQRIGKILLGSTVVLEMPEQWPVRLRLGDRVRAGETRVTDELTS